MGRHFGGSGGEGVLVARVVEGGPADRAGIEVGDVLTRCAGEEVTQPHDLRSAFRRELASPHTWATRIVVVGAAAAAGLVVVCFTWLAETALALFLALERQAWWLPLLWTPLCCAAIAWITRRHARGAGGSGIPQVMAALDPALSGGRRPLLVSLRLSIAKIGLYPFAIYCLVLGLGAAFYF